MMIKVEKIMSMLQTEYVGREIHYFQKVTSTNAIAKEEAKKNAKAGTVIIADTQTRGHGRLNRKWISPKGGVWLSIILKPTIAAEETPIITLATSTAVANTIHRLHTLKTEVKWPNDVLVNGRKICGILTESSIEGENIKFIIVGVGINANFNLDVLPTDLRSTTTSLKQLLRENVDLERLICVFLKEFEEHYELFKKRRFDALRDEWRGMAGFLGKNVEVMSFRETFMGKALDIDENGALIVELENGERRRLLSGDLTVRE